MLSPILKRLIYHLFLPAALLLAGCSKPETAEPAAAEMTVLMPPDTTGVWHGIFAEFNRRNPGIRIRHVEGPTATNTREDLYVTSFLSGQTIYDLVYADVQWIPKFASAGWIEDLTERWDAGNWARFLDGAIAGSKYQGRIYRMPVQMNGGVLFYRKDLLDGIGAKPPESFSDLLRLSQQLQDPPALWGFVWQGKQYEGLVCDYLEVLTGFGGTWIDPDTGRIGLDEPQAVAALEFLRDCIQCHHISPPGTTTYEEEVGRQLFHSGRAVFLRNWPYVWALAQKEDSPVRGKVGMVPMPRTPEGRHASTLGGWGFAIAKTSRQKDAAWKFLEYMATLEPILKLHESDGVEPALHAFYEQSSDPMNKMIYEVLQTTIPRPPIAQYAQASDILQRYVSAALTDRMNSGEALAAAAKETRLLIGRMKNDR
jgi:multiple sugar transport system substrate-binding protein